MRTALCMTYLRWEVVDSNPAYDPDFKVVRPSPLANKQLMH